MTEAVPRWRLFPNQIECDLRAHYHGVHIGMWHTGEMCSRELIVLTDGLPEDSWYKTSIRELKQRVKDDEARAERDAVKRLISAQLSGQKVGANV